MVAFGAVAGAGDDLPGEPRHTVLLLKSIPQTLRVADLDDGYASSTITDVEVADLDGDGRNEIIVVWYANDNQTLSRNLRYLSIYRGQRLEFTRVANINLFVPNKNSPALSVFRYGTGDAAIGDFDGDGDLDIAVAPFFGDELWFVENCGNFSFTRHLKYMFGYNSTNFLTPPALRAADLNGDGRAELIYVADSIMYPDGDVVHFWSTPTTIAAMSRLDWDAYGGSGGYILQFTWAMDVGDFDGDGRPDVAFSGTAHQFRADIPIFLTWYNFNPASGYFQLREKTPSFFCSDVVAFKASPTCPPGLVLTDPNGTAIEYWRSTCGGGPLDFYLTAYLPGYAGLAGGRGMAGVAADLDGDGQPELITKQKRGTALDGNQIEITYCRDDGWTWIRIDPSPLNTLGFQTQQTNELLRPKNLAVGDLFGNALPEIVAGFGPTTSSADGEDLRTLRVAIWANSCVGDVNRDCYTDNYDLYALMAAYATCRGSPNFDPHADVDKSGCVDNVDLDIVMRDVGCYCWASGAEWFGDLNCDGMVSEADIGPFVLALSDPEAYAKAHVGCPWLNADCNHDGRVDHADINAFLQLLWQP